MSNKIIDKIINLFTYNGERPPLNRTFNQIDPVLQFAYKFCIPYIKNKSVLDYGCGGGYGTDYLASKTSKNVVGYDISNFAVKTAQKYFSKKNLHFTSKLPNNKFTITTSFQVIEHLNQQHLSVYLSNIKKLTTKNGQIIIATVNKNITSFGLKSPIFSYHLIEYTPKELKKLLSSHFQQVKIFGQIDSITYNKVLRGQFSFDNLSQLKFKDHLIRYISQFSFVKFVSKNTPQFIKNLILQPTIVPKVKYLLTDKTKFVDNSYILIAVCKNS